MKANTPTNINLTAEGSTDWRHWGLNSVAAANYKSGAIQQIGSFTLIGGGVIQQFGNNSSFYNWSDGAPAAVVNNTATGV